MTTDALVLLGRLLDRAHEPAAPGQPRILAGPTWLLAQVIRTVAVDAMERYIDAGRAFCEGRVRPSIDEVRTALDTATAAKATVICPRTSRSRRVRKAGHPMSAISDERLAEVVRAIPPGHWMSTATYHSTVVNAVIDANP